MYPFDVLRPDLTPRGVAQWRGLEGYSGPIYPDRKPSNRWGILEIAGLKGSYLLNFPEIRRVGAKLNVDPHFDASVTGIENGRLMSRTLNTVSRLALLGGLHYLGKDNPTDAYWAFGTSFVALGAAYQVASYQSLVARNVSADLLRSLRELPVPDKLTGEIESLMERFKNTVPEMERKGLMRPLENIMFSVLQAVAAGNGNPAAMGWLGAGVMMLIAHDQVIKNWYSPKQQEYLNKCMDLEKGHIGLKQANEEAKKPTWATIPINGVSQVLKFIGYFTAYAGGSGGVVASTLPMIASAASSQVTMRTEIEEAEHAQNKMWQLFRDEIEPDLPHMILNQVQWTERRARLNKAPIETLREIHRSSISRALSFAVNYTNPRSGLKVETRALIDFTTPQKGMFLLIGENGVGKSILANLLSMRRSDGDAWVAITDEKRLGGIVDLKEIEQLSEVKRVIRYIKAGKTEGRSANFLEMTGLGGREAVALLNKYGWGNLDSVLETDLSDIKKMSTGEQVILSVLAQLKKAQNEEASVVIIDEPYATISLDNQLKLTNMFNDFVAHGLMVVVIAQNVPVAEGMPKVRGARLREYGFSYTDPIFVRNTAIDPDFRKADLFNSEMWTTMFGLGWEKTLSDLQFFHAVMDNTIFDRDDTLLRLIGSVIAPKIDKEHTYHRANIMGNDELGYSLLSGFAKYWKEVIGEQDIISNSYHLVKIVDHLRAMGSLCQGLAEYFDEWTLGMVIGSMIERVRIDPVFINYYVPWKRYLSLSHEWVEDNFPLWVLAEQILSGEIGSQSSKPGDMMVHEGLVTYCSDVEWANNDKYKVAIDR